MLIEVTRWDYNKTDNNTRDLKAQSKKTIMNGIYSKIHEIAGQFLTVWTYKMQDILQ